MKKHITLLSILLVVLSCTNDQDLSPQLHNSIDPQSWTRQDFSKFKSEIINDLDNRAESILDLIPEHLGKPFHEATVPFKSKDGNSIALIPVFSDQSSYTEGIVIVVKIQERLNYIWLQRGELVRTDLIFKSDPDAPKQYTIATVIASFDKEIFKETNPNLLDIIGYDKTGEIASQVSSDDYSKESRSEIYEQEICYFTFTGTAEDPYQNVTEFECFIEYIWVPESIANNTDVHMDAMPGGGGSTSNIRNCSGTIACFPLLKYPPGSDFATKYPKFTQLLKEEIPKIGDNAKILEALKKFTTMTEAEIKQQLKWGNGLVVDIKDLLGQAGMFDPKSPNKITIDIDEVARYEHFSSGTFYTDSFAFYMGITILHEFVHFGDYNFNSNLYSSGTGEEGNDFEVYLYGRKVDEKSAKIIIRKKND